MHIGIDARIYGIHHRGIGRYTERLISYLAKISDGNRYTLFMNSADAKKINLDKGKFKIVAADVPWYSLKEHFAMPGLIKKSKVEIMHWPHLNVSYFCPVPYVVTIHDLIVFHYPDSRATNLPSWKYKIKLWGYHKVLKNAVKKAKKIIAVSEYTKRDIVRHLGVDEKKITVAYLGVEKMVLGTEKFANTPQFSEYLSSKYKIRKQYILYVGSAYPHKNLHALIDAYIYVRQMFARNWQLVLAGRIDEFYENLQLYVKKSVKDESIRSDIVFAGEVSDRDLDGLYRGAKLFVFPSLYEGFGLPPLEAMSRLVPVVSSNSSCLPEILADSARYFDPNDVKKIAQALDMAGSSHRALEELVQKGIQRTKRFSWERMAEETAQVYKNVASS